MGTELVCAVLVNDLCFRPCTRSRIVGETGRWTWYWNHFHLENSWHPDILSVNVRNLYVQSLKIARLLTCPSVFCLLLMKQQLAITPWCTVVKEREKAWHIHNRPKLKHFMFLQKYEEEQFCVCVCVCVCVWTQHHDSRCVCNSSL